jgi:hypothetical protein
MFLKCKSQNCTASAERICERAAIFQFDYDEYERRQDGSVKEQ